MAARSLPLFALHLVLQVALALAMARAWLLGASTLERSGEWVATKATLERGVMGAQNFVKGRQSVEGSRLNLGAWFGFQEVLYLRPLRLSEAEFSFELHPEAYLHFVFARSERGFSGLRFSLSPRFPSMRYTASALGEFTSRERFDLAPITPRSWHRARVTFTGDGFAVAVDGAQVGRFRAPVPDEQTVGFRGGRRIARVQDVVFREREGGSALRPVSTVYAGFGTGHQTRTTVVFAIAVVAANGIAFALLRRRGRAAVLGTLVANGVGVVLALLLLAYFSFSAARYPALDAALRRNEEAWTLSTAEAIRASLRERYPASPHRGVARVLFLGTSQTWGAGAARKGETFVEVLERMLGERGRVECINAGISAGDSTLLLEVLREDGIPLAPEAVVIDLANNDGDPAVLSANVEQMVRLSRAAGAKPILVLEPNTSEDPAAQSATLRANHEALRLLGSRLDVPVVDMHAHLAGLEDRGLLWWDSVHLTSLGQRLFAERLRPEIEAALDKPGEPRILPTDR